MNAARDIAWRVIRDRQINHPAGCTEPPGFPCEMPCPPCLGDAVVDGLAAEGRLLPDGEVTA